MISDHHGAWRTSSRSGGGNCVEIAGAPATVAVRDSKDRIGPRLEFSTGEWAAFVADAKRGAFDRR